MGVLKNRYLIIALILGLGTLFLPEFLFAQSGGLVPCGGEEACTLCHGFILFKNIYTFLLGMLATVGVLAFVAGGVVIMTAGPNPQRFQQGKTIMVNAVIGIILVAGSFLILNTLVFILNAGPGEFFISEEEEEPKEKEDPSGIDVAFTLVSGQGLTIENCDTANRFKDRGGGSDVSPGGGGDGGSVSCSEGSCANDEEIVQAAENNAYDVDADIIMAIIQEGEGCNNAIRNTCYQNWNSVDCSCGYSQCNTDNREALLGADVSPQESCDILQNDIQKDIDCAARYLAEDCGNPDSVREAGRCYNAGPAGTCAQSTRNYCTRVENYYNQCIQ